MTETSPIKVLPWNGYKAAISLTFDDGDPSQLDLAIPEMDKRGILGSFYLVVNRLARVEEWKKVARSGHELGNHSATHRHGWTLTPEESETEVSEGKTKLQEILGTSTSTFVYPFSEVTPALRQAAEKHHFISRCGLELPPMKPESDPDWAYLPSLVALTQTSSGVYKGWADEALQEGGWTIPMFHSFEGTLTGWQPMARKNFTEFLDFIAARKNELWIAPLREVGAYWMGQKILENVRPTRDGKTTVWTWERPSLFPEGVTLRIQSLEKGAHVSQRGKTIEPDNNIYSISFDAQELRLTS